MYRFETTSKQIITNILTGFFFYLLNNLKTYNNLSSKKSNLTLKL